MEKFEFRIGKHGLCNEDGYLEAKELVELFEWWLKRNKKHFEVGQIFSLHERKDTIKILRELCDEFGDNDWEDGHSDDICDTNNYLKDEKLVPELMSARIQKFIDYAVEHQVEIQMEHIEMMCAAYFAKTDISPDEVVLVQEHRGLQIVWYFARKDDVACK